MITSHRNPKVKFAQQLRKSRVRRETGFFLVEGEREIRRALQSGFEIAELFVTCEVDDVFLGLFESAQISVLRDDVFGKLVVRESGVRALAVAKNRVLTLGSLSLPNNPFVISLEKVEKPGNLGAVIRTADAVSASAVFLIDPVVDLFNPNVVRASLGTIFNVPVISVNRDEAVKFCRECRLNIVSTWPEGAEPYYDVDFCQPTNLVLGAEDTGLSDYWQEVSDRRIFLPMNGIADSLNLSVATGVLAYEALRQRIY